MKEKLEQLRELYKNNKELFMPKYKTLGIVLESDFQSHLLKSVSSYGLPRTCFLQLDLEDDFDTISFLKHLDNHLRFNAEIFFQNVEEVIANCIRRNEDKEEAFFEFINLLRANVNKEIDDAYKDLIINN